MISDSERLARLEQLNATATKEGWRVFRESPTYQHCPTVLADNQSVVAETSGPNRFNDAELIVAARNDLSWLIEQAREAERLRAEARRFSLLRTAVAICTNDHGLTDLGTLKRTWFYASTGRDEPVGAQSWKWLEDEVRAHPAKMAPRGTSATVTRYPLAEQEK